MQKKWCKKLTSNKVEHGLYQSVCPSCEADKKQVKIQKLMDNHLVGWYEPAEKAMKAHYRISVENMVAFLDKYFEVK